MNSDLRFNLKKIGDSAQKQLDLIRDYMGNAKEIIPGAAFLNNVMDHDGILNNFWKTLLRVNFNSSTPGEWTPVDPVITMELKSAVEWFTKLGEAEDVPPERSRCFFRVEIFMGVERVVFRNQLKEWESIEKQFNDEIEKNGDTVWSFIVFALKARNYIFDNEKFEFEKISDSEFKITAVTPGIEGYYTVYINFVGDEEFKLLEATRQNGEMGEQE